MTTTALEFGSSPQGDTGFPGDAILPGERVRLVDDDWDLVGHKLVLLDPEPVPGSSQCLIADDGEPITVSRARLRRFV